VTTSGDGKLRLWDLATGDLIGTPLPGGATFGWGTSCPDGKHAISVFGDGTGVVWDRDPIAWEDAAYRVAHRDLTRSEWRELLPGRGYPRVCS
jgi:hypothetical protein